MGNKGRDQANGLKWREREHSLRWAQEPENMGTIIHSLGR